MHKVFGLVKVNVRVTDQRAALDFLERAFGAEPARDRGSDTIGEFDGAMARIGDLTFDVITPNDPDGAIAKSIEKRGQGYDSIALLVENLDDTVAHLEAMDVRVVNRTEYHGSRIAFVHPSSAHGMLIELIERPAGEDAPFSGAPR